jgi:hypothetical protein
VEITQSHKLAEGKCKVHKQQGVQRQGGSHLAEGKSKEKSLRIRTASDPILYTPLITARAITQYSPAILALTPLYLDIAYQAARFASKAVPTLELQKRCGGGAEFGTSGRTSRIGTGVWSGIGSREGEKVEDAEKVSSPDTTQDACHSMRSKYGSICKSC